MIESYRYAHICIIRVVKGVLKWIEIGRKELVAESIFMQFINVSPNLCNNAVDYKQSNIIFTK